jgi:6,7-dimethyl-8-ribityllumazine synthase
MPMTEIRVIKAGSNINECRIAIVASSYNSHVVDRLLDACLATLRNNGVSNSTITLVKVPGAFEIPVAVRKLAELKRYEAIITLGAIIRGETPHFDYIAQACTTGIAAVAADFTLPVIFGVLTVDHMQQALDRSGDEESNKGAEAAQAALEMISVMRKIGA